jgi:hypothetical protein
VAHVIVNAPNTHMISTTFGDMTMYQALRSNRTYGFGALARQSATSLLNAYYCHGKYAFTPIQVRFKFRSVVLNEEAAFSVAREFEVANCTLGVEHPSTDTECKVKHGRSPRQSIALHLVMQIIISV